MSSSRWPRSPSHGKCSRRFCGSSRNCGRSHHQRRREAFDGYAFMSNRQKECVQMPGKMARSDPRLSVRVTRGAGSGQHLASVLQEGRETRTLVPVWDSSGESRFYWIAWLAGVVVFAAVLRFGPWHTRYHLTAFALAAPIGGGRSMAAPMVSSAESCYDKHASDGDVGIRRKLLCDLAPSLRAKLETLCGEVSPRF